MMNFEREIICFDLETTGLTFKTHKIVQFACIIMDTNLNIIDKYNRFINPGNVEWSPKAIETHGITPDQVKDEPLFGDVAKEIYSLFENRDILTHNGNRFDIPFIANEFDLAGIEMNIDDINVFDTFSLEAEIAPRKLGFLFNKYTGYSMEEAGLHAHDALSDVIATSKIFIGQHKIFDISSFHNKTNLSRDIGFDGDVPFMMYGKYKGVPIETIIETDPNYLVWLIKERNSKLLFNIIKKIYENFKNKK